MVTNDNTPVAMGNLISQLRMDTVSQVMTMANVRASNKMVVMETCQGLLIGATLERMGGLSSDKLFVYYHLLGDGLLVQLFTGDLPVR